MLNCSRLVLKFRLPRSHKTWVFLALTWLCMSPNILTVVTSGLKSLLFSTTVPRGCSWFAHLCCPFSPSTHLSKLFMLSSFSVSFTWTVWPLWPDWIVFCLEFQGAFLVTHDFSHSWGKGWLSHSHQTLEIKEISTLLLLPIISVLLQKQKGVHLPAITSVRFHFSFLKKLAHKSFHTRQSIPAALC